MVLAVPVCASLSCHDSRSIQNPSNSKVCYLDCASLVQEQVGSFEIPVYDLALVQVVHATTHFCANLEDCAQLELTILYICTSVSARQKVSALVYHIIA